METVPFSEVEKYNSILLTHSNYTIGQKVSAGKVPQMAKLLGMDYYRSTKWLVCKQECEDFGRAIVCGWIPELQLYLYAIDADHYKFKDVDNERMYLVDSTLPELHKITTLKKSPSGGFHTYILSKTPLNLELKRSLNRLYNLDFRGTSDKSLAGAYVAYKIFINGELYEYKDNGQDILLLDDINTWIKKFYIDKFDFKLDCTNIEPITDEKWTEIGGTNVSDIELKNIDTSSNNYVKFTNLVKDFINDPKNRNIRREWMIKLSGVLSRTGWSKYSVKSLLLPLAYEDDHLSLQNRRRNIDTFINYNYKRLSNDQPISGWDSFKEYFNGDLKLLNKFKYYINIIKFRSG